MFIYSVSVFIFLFVFVEESCISYVFFPINRDLESAKLVNIKRCTRTLQRIRRECVPPNPTTIEAINLAFSDEVLLDTYGKALTDGNPLFFDGAVQCEDHSFCIFSSKSVISTIKKFLPENERHIMMDATFSIVPHGPFYQILILFIRKTRTVFPFGYILMSRKTQFAYYDALKYFHENVFELNAVSFCTDWEIAMRNAILQLFPDAEMVACYFHHTNAVKKHVQQSPELRKLIEDDANAKSIYFRLLVVPLLPPEYIIDVVKQLRHEALRIHKFNAYKQFFVYYFRQWIIKVNSLI